MKVPPIMLHLRCFIVLWVRYSFSTRVHWQYRGSASECKCSWLQCLYIKMLKCFHDSGPWRLLAGAIAGEQRPLAGRTMSPYLLEEQALSFSDFWREIRREVWRDFWREIWKRGVVWARPKIVFPVYVKHLTWPSYLGKRHWKKGSRYYEIRQLIRYLKSTKRNKVSASDSCIRLLLALLPSSIKWRNSSFCTSSFSSG